MKTNIEWLAERAQRLGFDVERYEDDTFTITVNRAPADNASAFIRIWDAVEHGPVDLDEYHERQREIGELCARYAAWARHRATCDTVKQAEKPCSCGLATLELVLAKHHAVKALADALRLAVNPP